MDLIKLFTLPEWLFFLTPLFFLPVLGYAEIHYRFPFFPSLTYQREPEIVFDLPIRVQTGQPVPLFLFIKDAHRFPIQIMDMEVECIPPSGKKTIIHSVFEPTTIDQKFHSRTTWLDPRHFSEPGTYKIFGLLKYLNSCKKEKIAVQDNYRGLPNPPFLLQVASQALPKTEGWYWGDLHLHSFYTDDQVEFGAPLPETVQAAQSIGLDFVAVTDHSYDLDDEPDNFLINDPRLQKWEMFKKEVLELQDRLHDFVIIAGEEVSVGNHLGKNVHCLVLNDPVFHPGNGDSAEHLRSNRPTLSLEKLLQKISPQATAIAAHPADVPPVSQRIVLRRGYWDHEDCSMDKISGLQLLNGLMKKSTQQGIAMWVNLLLQGKRTPILAGNDAHGNFNCYRQVNIPFVSMNYHREQILGASRTAIRTDSLQRESLLDGIRAGRAIISNGPFAALRIQGAGSAEIGDTHIRRDGDKIEVVLKNAPDYGSWKEFRLYFGMMERKEEYKINYTLSDVGLDIQKELDFPQIKAGYVRLEAFSQLGDEEYFCMTNPIWIEME